ncbi:YdcF family protein [Cognatiyoonia sp. IB215446]|uniref:YdcF family protein n=1 Tax=Cognatiyoonia sp. IB215446 TaxID=3097355 RepID=UPI002A15E1F4|nr:YdcF family protein [Cognatiyoonia sp. IB215446]MDX8347095.1 YdcF family protein [Cognatiyoonia sp. IB215446]
MNAILVLGAAVWSQGPSPTLRRRSLHAATLWHKGAAPIIVACGGTGQHPPSEAAAIRDLLREADVPADAIRLEDQSTTTLENIRNALPLLPGRRVIIVTDTYHARRAKMVARHFGLRATLDCPRSDRRHIRQHLRELIARPAYAMKLRREPRTYPPLTGN